MMTKDENLTPALRFPDFEEDWEYRKLGDFINDRKDVAGADLPLYSLTIESGIVPKSKRYERSFLVKSEESAYKLMKPKDFAYNPMNLRWGALACHHGDEEIAVSKYYDVFHANEKSVPEYLEPFLTSYKMVQFYDRMSEGTLEEKKRVHYLDFIHFKKLFPSLPEQQKIADFLSAVDRRIDQLIQKKALLEDYKKGVMQQLFTQAIRFKDDNGNDFPDWEEKKIGDFTVCTAGGTPRTTKKEFWDGEIRWMNSGELNLKKVSEVEGRITELGLKSSSTKLIPPFCVLIGLAGQGKTRGTVAFNTVELCTNQSIAAVFPNTSYDCEYLYHNLDYRYEELRALSTGDGGRGGLNLTIIRSIKIPFPTISEQTKIANFLSAIDRKIESVDTQITETQTFKKGLLQQMFV